MKNYYAFSNQYDRSAVNSAGERLGAVMIFASKGDRDQWIEEGTGFQREYISAMNAVAFMRHVVRSWRRDNWDVVMDDIFLDKVSDVVLWYRTVCQEKGFDPYVPQCA